MEKEKSIMERFRTVLKTTGTLGSASAGMFIDNFCDEIEREVGDNTGRTIEYEDEGQEMKDDE